jgi:hypothetical protein
VIVATDGAAGWTWALRKVKPDGLAVHESRAMRRVIWAANTPLSALREIPLDRLMDSWVFWALVAVVAIGLTALIGWALVWMLALSD